MPRPAITGELNDTNMAIHLSTSIDVGRIASTELFKLGRRVGASGQILTS